MGNSFIKNNFVEKTSKDFLIDPDTDVYYEVKITRVDKTNLNTNALKRVTATLNGSTAIYMEICKDYGLTPKFQKWSPDMDKEGKQIQGKGKWVSVDN